LTGGISDDFEEDIGFMKVHFSEVVSLITSAQCDTGHADIEECVSLAPIEQPKAFCIHCLNGSRSNCPVPDQHHLIRGAEKKLSVRLPKKAKGSLEYLSWIARV